MKKRSTPKRRTQYSPPVTTTAPRSALDKVFPIVAIGASAGGLEAFSALLANLPETTGMAYVFLQHLDPSHHSALEEILSRTTKIPVTQATQGLEVQRNHIYIIPPNSDMIIRDGTLRLSPRSLTHGQHRPIDSFFISLAEDCGDRAIGVILSGTASDGTSGCLAIKAVGGITLAQDEATAKYSSMPKSAVESGCVDFVLPPKAIAEELSRIEKHPYIARVPNRPGELLGPASPRDIHQLFTMLREAKGVDFTHYKQTTLQRRIKRRMVLTQSEHLQDYLHFVKRNPKELDELYKDVLIHVTGFFRDPGAFEALRKEVFPLLVKDRKPSDWPIRVWIPGCSTGEEAYSMAMALLEYIGPNNANVSVAPSSRGVQVFATDISDAALDRARAGVYQESVVADISPQRLKRFFMRVNKGYQILQFVREVCIFAKQNITKDPPFSGLDLISCRNLLIYLGPELQKRVIPTMHYALRPGAHLMLGGAESLGVFTDYFTLIDKKYKIYQKKSSTARLVTYFTGVDYSLRSRRADIPTPKGPPTALSIEKEVERELANRFVPASIVVNSEMEILQFRGKTGAYLEPAAGHPTFSLSKMAREGLLIDLRAALHTAKKENVPVRKEGVSIQSYDGTRLINFEVIPIQGEETRERFYIVVFQDTPTLPSSKTTSKWSLAKEARKDLPLARQKERLTREIRQLRGQLQSLIEEHETTLEEFKTANEEVLSSNEELQSTNEELETAKEELQSGNEELTTVNEELQNRNLELSTANNDLLNVLENVNIPVVIVSNEVRIRRFTPAAQKLLNLLPSDIGRYLGDVRPNIAFDNLGQVARETVESSNVHEAEVRDNSGVWYMLRTRPYKTSQNKVEGAVITFQDIDALKRVADDSRAYADTLINTAREAILILDADLRVLVANPAFYSSFQVGPEETVNRHIFDLGDRQWDIPVLRTLLENITRKNAPVDDFEVRHKFEHIGDRLMVLNARRIESSGGKPLIFFSIDDVTERRKSKGALERQAALLNLAHDTVIVRTLAGEILFWNRGAEEMYGWTKEEALGKTTHQLLHTEFPCSFAEVEKDLRNTGRWEGELVHTTKTGERRTVDSRWVIQQNEAELVILEINTDISDRKQSEETLRRLSAYLMTLQDEERRRIARELHDSTGQKLAAAKLQLDSLVKSGNVKSYEKIIAEATQWIDECFQEVRTLSQLLHPPLLDEAGLLSATRWMVDGFSARANIQVDFQITGEFARLPQPVELALFRVVQESLSNIRRHSGATKAQITLTRNDGSVRLEISDNGKGIPPERLARSGRGAQVVGVGILGMRERLAQLGGHLDIESNQTGTTIKVSVPVAAAASP